MLPSTLAAPLACGCLRCSVRLAGLNTDDDVGTLVPSRPSPRLRNAFVAELTPDMDKRRGPRTNVSNKCQHGASWSLRRAIARHPRMIRFLAAKAGKRLRLAGPKTTGAKHLHCGSLLINLPRSAACSASSLATPKVFLCGERQFFEASENDALERPWKLWRHAIN